MRTDHISDQINTPSIKHISYCIRIIRIWCLNIIIGVCKLSYKFIRHLWKRRRYIWIKFSITIHYKQSCTTEFSMIKRKPKNYLDIMYSSGQIQTMTKWTDHPGTDNTIWVLECIQSYFPFQKVDRILKGRNATCKWFMSLHMQIGGFFIRKVNITDLECMIRIPRRKNWIIEWKGTDLIICCSPFTFNFLTNCKGTNETHI